MATVQLVDELVRLDVAKVSDIPSSPAQIGAATAAQGDKADTAVQPAALAEVVAAIPTEPGQIGAATAAQGSKADSAVQPADLAAVAATIPTTAAQVGAATAAQGSKADTAVQPAGLAAVAATIPTTASQIGAATSAQGGKADTALQPAAIGTTVAPLVGGLVPSINLPSYVDDVLEFANLSALPGTGESGKIYITLDTNFEYRWSGSSYVRLVASPGSTDAVPEGSANLYFTAARVLGTVLSGLSLATSTVVYAADSLIVAIGKLQAQLSLKLAIASAFTNTATTGTNASSTQDVTVAPTANTTQVSIGRRTQMTYNSSFNALTGGYLVAQQDVVSTAGTGTHDKIVAKMAQLNLTGGNVAAAVGIEAVLSQIGATTSVAGAAGFLFANHRGVANIGNIATLAAFSNQDPVALMVSAGPYVNADLREIAPSRSAGLITGRYYSAPLKSMTTNIVATGVIYVTYVYVPRRCTLAALGFNVTVAGAGNGRLGLYKVANGILTALIVQTGDISTATTGTKEGTVSTQIDSGVYALVAEFSGTPTIGWHEINTHDMIGASSVTGFSEQAYITPFAYGALPATANILPTFAANTIEPHLFFRVSA